MRSKIGTFAATVISRATEGVRVASHHNAHHSVATLVQALPRQMERQAQNFYFSSVQNSFTGKLQQTRHAEHEAVFSGIAAMYRQRGGENYMIGETITQEEHVLQGAAIALHAGAPERVVIAALMHDIGHIAFKLDPHAAEKGLDTKHEFRGAAYLRKMGFAENVTDLVQMHVTAKRYLVSTDAGYKAQLSPASLLSLKLQGGEMPEKDIAKFKAKPHAEDALSLRLIDEMSKLTKLKVPDFASYGPMMTRVLAQDEKSLEAKDPNYRENIKALYQQMAKDPKAWEKDLRSRDYSALLPAGEKVQLARNASADIGRSR